MVDVKEKFLQGERDMSPQTLAILGILALVFTPAAWADHSAQHPPVYEGSDPFFEEPDNGRLRRTFATPITEIPVTIAPGEVLEIITNNPPEDGDPALHLLRQDTREEVAFDDSSDGALGARLTYSASSGEFILVVRARRPEDAGVTRLFRGSNLWMEDIAFGGGQLLFDGLRAGETLQSVQLPNGPTSGHRLYLLDGDGVHITQAVALSAVGGARLIEIEDDLASATVLVGTNGTVPSGFVRIVHNDVNLPGHDLDGDGLGTELEQDIGTCDRDDLTVPSAGDEVFSCERLADLRDTDGDGLRDDWETLGVMRIEERSENVRVHEAMKLPAWGASPRHKDVFIEVDFMQRSVGEFPITMTANGALMFNTFYADQVFPAATEEILRRARVLRNPDGNNGIRVHLDIGRDPEFPDHAVVYGDWGGFNPVAPVETGSGSVVGADYTTAWQDNMTVNRRGIFRYILAYDGGGGQTGIDSYSATGPINGINTLAHEFGHAMGMGHSGPPFATGFVDPNCKPNYPSIMNYAFLAAGVGFSSGQGRPALNNIGLVEFNAVDPANVIYLDQLETIFGYWVDPQAGHVDWNRDGEIAPAGTTVRGYANYRPRGGGCEFTRYNRSPITQAASLQSPGITRIDGRLVSVNATLGLPFFSREIARSACPEPGPQACIEWTTPERIPMFHAQGGLDIVKISDGRTEQAIVVAVADDGSVIETRLSFNDQDEPQWTPLVEIAGPGSAVGEPSLARLGACKVFLAYRDAMGGITTRRLTCADDFSDWGTSVTAVDQSGATIQLPDMVSPGIGRAYLNEPGRAGLYGAFANDASEHIKLYRFSEGTQTWTLQDIMDANSGAIRGRPVMVWTSENSEIDFPGRLILFYIRRDDTRPFRQKQRPIWMMSSYVRVSVAPDGSTLREVRVGLPGPFDNVWAYGFGIDAYFEAGVDTNLQTLHAVAIDKAEIWATLEYRPKADGVNDFTMTNFDDWRTMERVLCRNLVDAAGTIPTPAVQCR